MQSLIDLLALHSDLNRKNQGNIRIGIITSVDPSNSSVKVLIQPDGILSGWLPVATIWAGAGWGIFCPPGPGDQVIVFPQEGHAEAGVVFGSLFSKSVPPPSCATGELVLKHKSGATLTLSNTGVVQITGDLHVSGDIYDSKGSLDRLRQHYDQHVHLLPSGGVTSQPIPQD